MSSSSAPALPPREDADLADDVARILRVTLAERREELQAAVEQRKPRTTKNKPPRSAAAAAATGPRRHGSHTGDPRTSFSSKQNRPPDRGPKRRSERLRQMPRTHAGGAGTLRPQG